MFDVRQEHRCVDETAPSTWSFATRGPTTPTTRQASASVLKEPAMRIGKEQQEFEILPTEEDQQPVAPSEPEPQQQPEDAPA
jgi:hypothetical protein